MAPFRWGVSVVLVAGLCPACEQEPQASGTVVRDSVGIRIVENRHPSRGEAEGWQVDPEPVLDLGTVEGDEPYQLFGVVDAVRLSDGRVVVVNGGSDELRCFASDGGFLWSAGKEGEGPGEFLVPVWLQRLDDDTVAAYDFRLRRLSIVDGDGVFVRSYQIPPDAEGERVTAVGLFDGGSVLLQSLGSPPVQGRYRDTLSYYRFGEDEGSVARLGRFPGWEKFFWSQGNTRGLADHPFGLGSFPVAHGDRFVLGINDGYEFAEYALDGALLRVVRREHTNLPVTPGDVDRYREQQLEAARAFWQGLFPHITFPQTMPAYRRLLVDSEGYFWVEEYRRPDDEIPRWTVFEPDGQLLGTLTLPTDLRVFEIGADYVLGVWRDELDVEHVRLHELRGRAGRDGGSP
jgi:hypothetical protein